MKDFIYFPSFSAGVYGAGAKNNWLLKNGSTCRFYSSDFPEQFRYPYFLWPAGHFYKKKNIAEEWGFDKEPDAVLFGDSGGYQIASGAIKWDQKFKEVMLNWLEDSSTIAMNLDIPPRLQYNGKFDHCLELSRENIKYFYENRKGKVKFLNVIQGNDELSYKEWYNQVKEFEFEGWSIGGAGGSIYRFLSGILAFLSGKEHLNPRNEYFHVLGTSKIIDFLIISQLQKSLNDVGSNVQVTTDSSSPNRSTVYGLIYCGYDLRTCSFRSLHFPKDIEHGSDRSNHTEKKLFKDNDFKLPVYNQFHEWLKDGYEYNDIKTWNNIGYMTSVLHNFYLFQDAIKEINYYINGEPYLMEQLLSKDTFLLLKLIDDLVKSDNPELVFAKNKPFILKANSLYTEVDHSKSNDFF